MLTFSKTQQERMIQEIHAFYTDVLDEEISYLREQQMLEFISERIAPVIYNKALDDAQSWFKEQLYNVEIDYSLLYRD